MSMVNVCVTVFTCMWSKWVSLSLFVSGPNGCHCVHVSMVYVVVPCFVDGGHNTEGLCVVVPGLLDGEHDTEGLYVLIDGEHNTEGFIWLLRS